MERKPLSVFLFSVLLAVPSLAGEKVVEIPRLGSISTPLTNTGVTPSGLATGPGLNLPAIPPLPSSLVNNTVAGATAVQGAQKLPGKAVDMASPTQAAPLNPPGPNNPNSAAPAGPPNGPPPYFAEALIELGAPKELALKLAAYQEPRHPGEQDQIYHNLQHSRDVPDLVARALKGPAGAGLSTKQKAMLIVAAAFHDVDPERKPGTPARVSATLAYMDKDAESKQLLADLGKTFGGFTPGQVKALIKATDFNADPVKQAELKADFERMAQESFPLPNERDWAVTWGERLSFFDKSATYVGTVNSAEKQVINLASEIRNGIEAATGVKQVNPTAEVMLKGSADFLTALKNSPNFALLPAAQKENFLAVAFRFEDIKAGKVDASKVVQSRGPPVAAQRALDSAAGQAKAPVSIQNAPYFVHVLASLGVPNEALLAFDATLSQESRAVANFAAGTVDKNGYSAYAAPDMKAAILAAAALRGSDLNSPAAKAFFAALQKRFIGFSQAKAASLAGAKDVDAEKAWPGQPDTFKEWSGRIAYFAEAVEYKDGQTDRLRGLVESPHFVYLPRVARLALLRAAAPHYDAWMQPVNGERGPPDAALTKVLLETLDQQALPSAAELAAFDEKLKSMHDAGWSSLPLGALLTQGQMDFLIRRADLFWPDGESGFRTWEFAERVPRVNKIQDAMVVTVVEAMANRLTALLSRAMPGEELFLSSLELRLGPDRLQGMHFDGGYVTTTLTLRGPGTMVYEELDGQLKISRAQLGEATTISNNDRQFVNGVPATVHSSPAVVDPLRIVFIIRHGSRNVKAAREGAENEAAFKKMEEANRPRIKRVVDLVNQRQPNPKAQEKGGKGGIWSKLFE